MREPTNRQLIADLRRFANFENADFDRIGDEETLVLPHGKVTEFIRERTRLYRQSWVEPLIAAIEARLVKEPK